MNYHFKSLVPFSFILEKKIGFWVEVLSMERYMVFFVCYTLQAMGSATLHKCFLRVNPPHFKQITWENTGVKHACKKYTQKYTQKYMTRYTEMFGNWVENFTLHVIYCLYKILQACILRVNLPYCKHITRETSKNTWENACKFLETECKILHCI